MGQNATTHEPEGIVRENARQDAPADIGGRTAIAQPPAWAARFWARVKTGGPDACWEWTRERTGKGYGRVLVMGAMRRAHRVAWTLVNGPIPDGMVICHRCDNPPCCNPAHLFLGTVADNNADMAAKGRSTRGELNPRARFTAEQIRAIRRRVAAGDKTADVARCFGARPDVVRAIVCRLTWRWLP